MGTAWSLDGAGNTGRRLRTQGLRDRRVSASAMSEGSILKHQLNTVATLPGVGTQMAGNMECPAAALQQHLAELAVQSPEGDRLQPLRPGAAGQDAADVV